MGPGRATDPGLPQSRLDLLWPWACGLAVALLAALISDQVFGRIPHVQDSIAQLFQARIFAHGRLWWPAPPAPEFFEYTHMILGEGRWYSQYPPGHPLLLMVGVWIGAPWLINPILAGFSTAGACLLARELFDTAVARATGLLALVSPFLLLMAGEFMSHVGGLFALTWFLLFLFRTLRSGRIAHGLAAGGFLALAVLVRPYTALGLGGPFLIYAGWRLLREGRRLIPAGVCLAAGGLAGAILLGLYNWGTTGDPLLPGYIKLYGESHGLGFGKGSWGPPHTLLRGLRAAGQNLTALNTRLFEWPLSSLWPLVISLIPFGEHRSLSRRWLLAAGLLGLLLVHLFYWYHDLCFGPRYLYEALGPILILSAFGLVASGRWLADRLYPRAGGWLRLLPGTLLVLGLVVYSLAVRVPVLFRMSPEAAAAEPGAGPRLASYFQRFGLEFWGVSPYLGRFVERQVDPPALVFVRSLEPEFPVPQMRHLWFGSAFARIDPDFRSAGVVYARDLGDEDRRLAELFPERSVYLYIGTIEQGRLELLRGPIQPPK